MSKKMNIAIEQHLIPIRTEISKIADVLSYIRHSLKNVKSESDELEKLKKRCDEHFNQQNTPRLEEGRIINDPFDVRQHLVYKMFRDLEDLKTLTQKLQGQSGSPRTQSHNHSTKTPQHDNGSPTDLAFRKDNHSKRLSKHTQREISEAKSSESPGTTDELALIQSTLGHINERFYDIEKDMDQQVCQIPSQIGRRIEDLQFPCSTDGTTPRQEPSEA